MLVWRGKYDKAVAEARKASALDANNSDSLVTLAEMLIWSGSPQEAFAPIERARRLDPHNEAYHAYVKGLAEFSSGQLQRAAVSLKAALDLNPEFLVPAAPLAATYAHLDRLPEARAAQGRELQGGPVRLLFQDIH